MSVSAGTGGTSVVGVVVGGGTVAHSGVPVTASVLTTLPFTGASHLMDMVAVALVLLVTGVLALGLVRRRATDGDLT